MIHQLYGFRTMHEKVEETLKSTLSSIITMTIVNYSTLGFPIDYGSSCNLVYLRIFNELGLKMQDRRSCEGLGLLEIKDSSTCSCGQIYLVVSLGE